MKAKIKALKKEYDKVKSQAQDNELELSEMKQVARLNKKISKMIKKLENIVNTLNEAEEYGQNINTARSRIKKELKNLEVLKETV